MFKKHLLVSAITLLASSQAYSASSVDSFTLDQGSNTFATTLNASNVSAQTEVQALNPADTFDYTFNYALPLTDASYGVNVSITFNGLGFSNVDLKFDDIASNTVTDLLNGYDSRNTPATNTNADYYFSENGSGNFNIQVAGTILTANSVPSSEFDITVTPNLPFGAVPEPEQWALLLLGFPLLASAVKRKKA